MDLEKKKPGTSKKDPTVLRLMSEQAEMDEDATPGVKLTWPEKLTRVDDLIFDVKLTPQEGLYEKATFEFKIKIPQGYPHLAPTVTCNTRVYHPNIDLQGRVCLNILRAEWAPVLGISHVLFGLMTLFLEPNPDDPLNHEAADLMVKDYSSFKNTVYRSLRGEYLCGHHFPKLL